MPRHKQRNRQQNKGKGNKHGKPNEWNQDFGVRGNYALTERRNALFEKYYQSQELMPAEEWEPFMEALKEPLPCTFRIAGNKTECCEMLKIIKGSYLNNLLDVKIDGKAVDAPLCLPWYPDEVAWQVNLDRKFIRHSAALKNFHKFLIQETESGNISRQEGVSMIPPLVLDVQPSHKVLDMCAAPGSKTAQLIEMLHSDENITVPDGFVVANDSDNKRCYLMVHQVRRLQSPCFMVCNHDASAMPSFKVWSKEKEREVSMQFDRVLCDVPCSGDGTLRKNYDAWKKWNPGAGYNLHNLQTRILNRGLELLEVGGRLVYSTCSFNPIENEAVLCRMLQKVDGAIELVDISDKLPGLKYEKGLTNWKVMDRDGEFYTKFEDVPERLVNQIRPSAFPPTQEEADAFQLQRCMRILPHKQNTGGFFIAVLEKKKEVPWVTFKSGWATEQESDGGQNKEDNNKEGNDKGDNNKEGNDKEGNDKGDNGTEAKQDEKAAGQTEEGDEKTAQEDKPGDKRKGDDAVSHPFPKRNKPTQIRGYKEDPFVFLDEDEPVWPGIRDYFDISPDFSVTQLMVRCKEGKKRNLYYTSAGIKELVQRNSDRFKFINMGLKVFARSESKYVNCDFRIVQDGLGTLFPFIRTRIVRVLQEDLVVILSQENPFLTKLTPATKEELEKLDQGGLVYVYEPDGRPESPACSIVVCGWLGKVSCRSFLPKNERAHYLRLCGEELKSKDDDKEEKPATQPGGQGDDPDAEERALIDADDSKPAEEKSAGSDAGADENGGEAVKDVKVEDNGSEAAKPPVKDNPADNDS